jgi:ABC-2 family transporter protein
VKAIAHVISLDLRTIVPYGRQALIIAVVVMAVTAHNPQATLPALVLLGASVTAGYPFMIADKEDLATLYGVLPVTRRSLLLGHYVLALATFVVYAVVGTIEALVSAHVQNVPFSPSKLTAVLAISWVLFALNVAIKFPLFVRFGYTQIGMLGTTLPIAVIAAVATRTHVSMPSAWWLGVFAAASAIVLALSAVVAYALDPRRVRRPDHLALQY